jgi:Uma2 family endonuclease
MFDVVVPDLLVVMGDQDVLTKKNCHGAPALVIEILSPATAARDRTKKRVLYERCGVREYWVVDPRGDAITVHRRSGDRFDKPVVFRASEAQTLETPLLPGFSLPLTPYFRD